MVISRALRKCTYPRKEGHVRPPAVGIVVRRTGELCSEDPVNCSLTSPTDSMRTIHIQIHFEIHVHCSDSATVRVGIRVRIRGKIRIGVGQGREGCPSERHTRNLLPVNSYALQVQAKRLEDMHWKNPIKKEMPKIDYRVTPFGHERVSQMGPRIEKLRRQSNVDD